MVHEAAGTTNPERWLQEHGDELFGFALIRVRDRTVAEDLVQETFLAALRARGKFAGRSTERAWLFGILRKKVVDYYRRKSREPTFADGDFLGADEGKFFRDVGPGRESWIKSLAPQHWAAPDESLSQKEFYVVFHRCIAQLPERVAQVFVLRELDDLSSAQICEDLNLTESHYWVISYRARMALRRCLELHWFGRKKD